MSRRRLRIAALFAVAAAVGAVGVLSAGATSSGSAAASRAPTVKFQLSFFANAQHVGYLVASHRGFYSKAGLNVKVIPSGPTVEPTLLLAQGQADIAQVDFTNFVQAVEKGAPMTYVGLTYQQDPLDYVALKSTPLSSPADLKGKTIGQQQAGDLEPELLELLDKAGLTVNDVKPIAIGFTIDDLLSGKCQVFPSRVYFHPAEFSDKGISYPSGLNILDSNKLGVAIASQGIAVNNNFLKKHPAQVVAFLKASLQGWRYSISNPKASVADVEAFIPKGASNPHDDLIDIKTTNNMVDHNANGTPYKNILAINMAYLNASQNTLFKYKVIPSKINIAKYVNLKLLEQARAELAQK